MHRLLALLVACILLAPLPALAVTIQWSLVGNPGNADDPADGDRFTAGVQNFGAVPYSYKIGTYDVTNRQYAEFLNTKDPGGANPLFLWNGNMDDGTRFGGINFNAGNPAGSKYVLVPGRQDHPVNHVTWYSAIRFANWLNNGQGNGDTETGAYTLLGGTYTPTNGVSIVRNAGAQVFLPSENEWYKAAYYNPATGSYFQYATSSNGVPIASGPTDLANHANFGDFVANLTDVGAYTGTTSPYGAFDMNGNVFQWNQASIDSFRGTRGGSWKLTLPDGMHSSDRFKLEPANLLFNVGFRVAAVPEPSTLALAALGALGLLIAARRRR